VDVDQAAVSVLDHGVTVGDGVFETVLVRDGAAFALSRHLVRLAGSAAGLGIDAPAAPRLREAVDAVLADATGPAAARGRLRLTVTSGVGPAASERGSGDPTLIVTLTPAAPWPPAAAVVTVPWVRNERSAIAGLKTTSYAENAVALARARSRGASEALLANTRGELCEGTGSNVFVVVGGRLLTPPLSSGALAGITRGLVLEGSDGAQEQALAYDVLRSADEVFLTSSTREVQPVVTVDERQLAVGPVTLAVAARFTERAGADPDP
jgi:branched-chain amino acid aminotransferase